MAQKGPTEQNISEPQQSISPEQKHYGQHGSTKDSKSLLHGVNYSFSQQHFQALQAQQQKQQEKQVQKEGQQKQQNRPPPGPSAPQIQAQPLPVIPNTSQQYTPYLGQGKKSMSVMQVTSEQMDGAISQNSNVENNFSKDRNSISMASVQNAIETSGIQNTFTEALHESARIKMQKSQQNKHSPGQTSAKKMDKSMELEQPIYTSHLPNMTQTQQNFTTEQNKLLPPADQASVIAPTLPPTSYRPSGRVTSIERQEQIQKEMIAAGFRPASKENQFEYDSDSVEVYNMISNEFDYETIRKSDTFGIKQYRDCIYRGQLSEIIRQREGFGVLVYKNGRIYEGEWSQNKRNGRGYEVFSNGNTYQGNYEGGRAHGKGVYTWKNGEVYDGEWQQGVKSGYGVWKGTNGESYIGQWQDSKAQGYGVHVWGNGDKYEGEWEGCLRNGNGSDFFTNGDVFVGQYKNGKPEGFGQYKWINGSSYTGQFSNGLKHGHGKWKKKQADEQGNTKCNSYDGQYVNDKKHGHGTFEWESGNIYVGNYHDDERQGYGVMRWTDGSTYMGTWEQGIQEGIGVMIFPDGSRRAGIFEYNVFKASVKSREQIEPFRNKLDIECFQELEKIVALKQQETLARDEKSREERSQSWERALGGSNEKIPAVVKSNESLKKSKESKGTQKDENENIDDTVSDISKINKNIKMGEKEDKNQTMQKGAPMKKVRGMQQQMPSEAEIKHDVQSVVKRYGGTGAPLPQSLALNKRGPPVNQFLQKHMPKQIPEAIHSPTQTSKASKTMSQFRASKNSQKSNSPKLKIQHGQVDLGKTTGTMAVQTDLNMASMDQLSKPNQTQQLRHASQRPSVHTQVSPQQSPQQNRESQNRKWGFNPNQLNAALTKPAQFIQHEAELEAERRAQYNFAHPLPEMIGQNSFANQLPNSQFLDTKINENIMMSGPPNAESDSDFNRNSSMMIRNESNKKKRRTKQTGHGGKSKRETQEQAFGKGNVYNNYSQPRHGSQQNDFNTLTDPRVNANYSPMINSGSAAAYLPQQQMATINHAQQLSPIEPISKRNSSLNDRDMNSGPLARQYAQTTNVGGYLDRQVDYRNVDPNQYQNVSNFHEPAQNFYQPHGLPKPRQSRSNFMSQISTHDNKQNPNVNQSYGSGAQRSNPNMMNQPQAPAGPNGAQYNLPEIGSNYIYSNEKTSNLQTPVQNPNLRAFHDINRLRQDNSWQNKTQPVEEILTPSPKQSHLSSHNQSFQNNFNRSMAQSSNMGPIGKYANVNDSMVRHSPVAEPDRQYTDNVSQVEINQSRRQSSLARGKSGTSSQRTLRYNDFELVQTMEQDKEEYRVHLDDNDDKHSSVDNRRDKEGGTSSQYQEIRQQKYIKPQFNNQGIISSQGSLVNQQNSGSFRNQNRKSRMNNSNDTQLASHTIGMQHAGLGSQDSSPLNQDHKRIQRSVPVHLPATGKIKVNQNILNPDDFRIKKIIPANKQYSPPMQRFSEKPPRRGRIIKVDNSNSRKRIIDMRGPYAQNLTKPKLDQARGLQKIALKNQLQQNWAKPHGYNSEVYQQNWNNSLNNQNSSSGDVGKYDERDNKRVGSLGALGTQNYVIQMQLPGQAKLPHSLDNQHYNKQRKKVWVPSNTKRQLKQIQMGMNGGSVFSQHPSSGVRRSP